MKTEEKRYAVLFDLDGVIFDTSGDIRWKK